VPEALPRPARKNLANPHGGEALASRIQWRFSMWNIPEIAAVLATWALGLTTVGIVAIVCWYKARDKEMQIQREMRIREMEHQQRMRELEVEREKAKASQVYERTA
jgi:hypothetical protein